MDEQRREHEINLKAKSEDMERVLLIFEHFWKKFAKKIDEIIFSIFTT